MNMCTASTAIPRAPFFGSYIMETTKNGLGRENAEKKRKRDARLKEIFEAVDDYVEQA